MKRDKKKLLSTLVCNILQRKEINNQLHLQSLDDICGCPRTEDGSKELRYDCGNVTTHGPEEERHPRKGGYEPKYSKGFQVGAKV